MLITSGCSSNYRVIDPASGKTYHTTEVEEAGRSGAVKFVDEQSGGTVTLQSSNVKELSSDEYEESMAKNTGEADKASQEAMTTEDDGQNQEKSNEEGDQ